MKIYKPSGEELLDVLVDETSYRNREIMGDDSVVLHFALAEHVEIPVGAYITYEKATYTLERPEALTMKHTRYFDYTVTFEAYAVRAKRWVFRNPADGRLTFPLTAKPVEHLRMFVDNMNRRDSGWAIGECLDAAEKLVNYDKTKCYGALEAMAEAFGTEFEIVGKTVSLHRVEYNKSAPLALAYGRGKGLVSGVGRSSSDDLPVEVLFAEGGSENIDASKYGNTTLLLPAGQSIGYDGEHFSDESGYVSASGRQYAVSADGLSVSRSDKSLSSYTEDCLDCSDIYPKRVGTVKTVVVVDEAKNFYDIVDANPASDPCPNYEEYLIAGEQMTIVFQDGRLAGREFDVKYHHEAVTEKGAESAARRFEIVPAELDGVMMPSALFAPAEGDTFVVLHCALPTEYICDNDSRSGASWEMLREAVRYLYDNEEEKFTFSGTLDAIWAKKDWENIGGKIKLGGYVSFTDERFQASAVLVRITAVKDYINNPHAPEVTLSNETVSTGFASAVKKVAADVEVVPDEALRRSEAFTKRRFRDAKETMEMLSKNLIEGYGESIQPAAAQMLQLIVGDESLQYRFVDSATKSIPTIITPAFKYNDTTGVFTVSGGYILQHLTLGVDTVKSSHDVSEYKWWTMSAFESAVLSDESARYYLYAKCPTTSGGAGVFTLEPNAIKMTEVAGYYHFLVGVLNSEYEGKRSFTTLYGFTEIAGGRITTDKIVSADGKTYFDLVNSIIGGNIKFRSTTGEEKNVNALETDIEAAKTAAEEAKSELDSWASDSVVSPTEKAAIEQMGANIKQDYLEVVDRCTEYGVSTTSLESAYTKAIAAVTKYTSTTTELIAIESDYDDIAAYWTTRKETLALLNDAVSKKLSTMQDDITAAEQEASEAKTTLSNWASDGKISPTEKTALDEMEAQIRQDYLEVIDRCGKYSISTTTFTAAYNKAIKALEYYTATSTWSQTLTIGSDYDNIAAYWTAKKAVLLTLNTQVYGTLTQLRTDVDDAAADAASAVTTAKAAQTELTSWSDDGNVSPVEKRSLAQMEEQIKKDYAEIVDRCTKYSITYSSLTTAYNNAISSLNYYTASPEQTTAISSSYPYSYIAAYWDARTTLLKTINTSLKNYTDGLVDTAVDNLTKAYQSGDEATIQEAETQVAALGETIINGGVIETVVLKALAINAAKAVQVGTAGGQRVDILAENKSVDIYDSSGKLVQKLEGNSYNSLASLFGDASGTITITSSSGTYDALPTLSGEESAERTLDQAVSAVKYTAAPTEISLKYGKLYAYTLSGEPASTTGVHAEIGASANIRLVVRTYSDSSCTELIETLQLGTGAEASVNYKDDGAIVRTSQGTCGGYSVRVAAGYHKLFVIGLISACGAGSKAYVKWGYSTSLSTLSYSSEFYVSRFFANGFCLGTKTSDYIFVYNQSSSLGMRLIMENNGYGIDVSHNGIQIKHHSGSWMSLPLFVAKFRVNVTSSGATMISQYTWNGTALSSANVSRSGTGTIKITFPTAWSTLGLNATNMIINAVGYVSGSEYSKPTLGAISSTGFTLYLSDDNTLNDKMGADVNIFKIS